MNDTDRMLVDNWCRAYISGTLKGEDAADVIQKCCKTHYDALDMDNFLEPYIGNLNGFLSFLQEQWKWKISGDLCEGQIIADENKDHCVCPLYNKSFVNTERLCLCSEGFAQKMFSKVLGKDVKATVIQSYIRDRKSCQYQIEIPE